MVIQTPVTYELNSEMVVLLEYIVSSEGSIEVVQKPHL